MNYLSDQEVLEYTEKGKGINCAYAISACCLGYVAGYDCGTCAYIFKQCGYNGGSGGGSGSGGGCTAH